MAVYPLLHAVAPLWFAFAMVRAGLSDLTTLRIRNHLVIGLLLGYALCAPASGQPLAAIAASVGVSLLVLAGGFVLFTRGWMGGGDVKLAAATALWLGIDHTAAYLTYTALAGGVLALFLLQIRQIQLPARLLRVPWAARLHDPDAGVPYGIALTIAALLVFPQTTWIHGIP